MAELRRRIADRTHPGADEGSRSVRSAPVFGIVGVDVEGRHRVTDERPFVASRRKSVALLARPARRRGSSSERRAHLGDQLLRSTQQPLLDKGREVAQPCALLRGCPRPKPRPPGPRSRPQCSGGRVNARQPQAARRNVAPEAGARDCLRPHRLAGGATPRTWDPGRLPSRAAPTERPWTPLT